MERREVLKLVALTALSQKLNALPNAAMAHMQTPTAAPAPYSLQFFTEEQSLFLDQLMDKIIPADDHSPGAHEARTNLFADLMVATGSDAVRQQWQQGLHLFREEVTRTSLDDALRQAAANEQDPKTELDRFFVTLKRMTVNGYYTSTIGIHQELEYVGNAYLGAFPPCTHPEHQEAAKTE